MSIYVYMSMCDTWIHLAGLYVSKLPGKENSLINIATSNIRQTLLNKINAKKSMLSQDTTGVSENIGCSEVWDKLPTCGTQPTCTLINLLLKKKKNQKCISCTSAKMHITGHSEQQEGSRQSFTCISSGIRYPVPLHYKPLTTKYINQRTTKLRHLSAVALIVSFKYST